ncbi:CD59 glycoprotein [Cyprinodon tularosa]|uniref:CD59 glycoprotein-like n=1 Tax=Cyprinodon variegatus TaxID=28743 RepID=A0A3Q2CD72_CYPVA|nr:PREDICTED: CD59 glycoprotein-like [Cyprinodon variegatus]XP_038146791.1 CD59 glycoprotein [Cyprinodon tularosa]
MKLLVLTLTLALLFTAGWALRCHRCVPKQAGGSCQRTEETCRPDKDACVAAKFLRQPFGRFQRCIALRDCKMLQMNAYIDINCCTEDMCNTFQNVK